MIKKVLEELGRRGIPRINGNAYFVLLLACSEGLNIHIVFVLRKSPTDLRQDLAMLPLGCM